MASVGALDKSGKLLNIMKNRDAAKGEKITKEDLDGLKFEKLKVKIDTPQHTVHSLDISLVKLTEIFIKLGGPWRL